MNRSRGIVNELADRRDEAESCGSLAREPWRRSQRVAGERGRQRKIQVETVETAGRRLPAIVLVIAFLVPLLNVIPTMDGYLKASPPERVFLGFRYMARDHFQYGSFVRQAADEGRFVFENRFTTEPQRPSYVFPFFWLIGMICRFTGLSFPAVWELMRVVTGAACLIAAWFFTKSYFAAERERLLAYLLIALSGGIGWLTALLPAGALDRQGYPGMVDPFNYQWNWSTFGTMATPFWLIPTGLLLVTGILLTKDPPISRAAGWAMGLVIPPVIWFVHPHTGNAAYLTFGLYTLAPAAEAMWRIESISLAKLRDRVLTSLPFIVSFAFVAAYLRWASQDQVFKANSEQAFQWNPTYSVFLYPLAYGLVLVLALFGMRWSGSLAERPRHFLFAWMLSSFILATNPIFSGVKYQYLLHLPLAIFAAHGLIELRRRSEQARSLSRGTGAVVLGAILFVNAPLTIFKDFGKTASESDIYYSEPELEAARFLLAQPAGTILSSFQSGTILPWLSGHKVYEGHFLLTVDMNAKYGEFGAFLDPKIPTAGKRTFLRTNDIRYVLYGPTERQIGSLDPAIGLESIYDKGGVAIYRVP